MSLFFNFVYSEGHGGQSAEALVSTGLAWVDVRELGRAHTVALEREEAGGERIIISFGRCCSLTVIVICLTRNVLEFQGHSSGKNGLIQYTSLILLVPRVTRT
jgi:hypothetical protein